MTFQQLQYFLEVHKAGAFSKAAKNLSVTTSSVSITIGNLEKELGYPLFVRSQKGLVLTANGEKVLEHAAHICERYRQLGHIQDRPYNSLHIETVNYEPAKAAIIRLIKETAHRRDTGITVSKAASQTPQNIALFETDIGIAQPLHSRNLPLHKMLQRKGLTYQVLDTVPFEIMIGRNHRLYHADHIAPSDLENDTFLEFSSKALSESYALKGVLTIPPENVVALYSDDLRYKLLQQGVGYTLSRRPADDICERYGLRCIPLKDVYVDIICITNPARPLSEVGNRFLSLLKEEIAKSKIQSNFPSE